MKDNDDNDSLRWIERIEDAVKAIKRTKRRNWYMSAKIQHIENELERLRRINRLVITPTVAVNLCSESESGSESDDDHAKIHSVQDICITGLE